MKTYKVIAKNKETGKRELVKVEAHTKKEANIKIRIMGYSFSERKLKEEKLFNWIIDKMDDAYTNEEERALYRFNKIPKTEEEYKNLFRKYTKREIEIKVDRHFKYKQKKEEEREYRENLKRFGIEPIF